MYIPVKKHVDPVLPVRLLPHTIQMFDIIEQSGRGITVRPSWPLQNTDPASICE